MLRRKSNWAECWCGEEWWLHADALPRTCDGGIMPSGERAPDVSDRYNNMTARPPGCWRCRTALWRFLAVRINWVGGRG